MATLIWAQDRNGVIGRDGQLPWHLPEDMAHFRKMTTQTTVVMGRRTWESLPERYRPLPDRHNVVLTRDPSWAADGAEVAHDPAEAVERDAWVIGGAHIYRAALPYADRIVRTEIDLDVPDGDAYAPELGPEWVTEHEGDWQTSTTGLQYRVVHLVRADTV